MKKRLNSIITTKKNKISVKQLSFRQGVIKYEKYSFYSSIAHPLTEKEQIYLNETFNVPFDILVREDFNVFVFDNRILQDKLLAFLDMTVTADKSTQIINENLTHKTNSNVRQCANYETRCRLDELHFLYDTVEYNGYLCPFAGITPSLNIFSYGIEDSLNSISLTLDKMHRLFDFKKNAQQMKIFKLMENINNSVEQLKSIDREISSFQKSQIVDALIKLHHTQIVSTLLDSCNESVRSSMHTFFNYIDHISLESIISEYSSLTHTRFDKELTIYFQWFISKYIEYLESINLKENLEMKLANDLTLFGYEKTDKKHRKRIKRPMANSDELIIEKNEIPSISTLIEIKVQFCHASNLCFFNGYYLVGVLNKMGEIIKSIKPMKVNDPNAAECYNLLQKYLGRSSLSYIKISYNKSKVLSISNQIQLNIYVTTLKKYSILPGDWWDEMQEFRRNELLKNINDNNGKSIENSLLCKSIYIDALIRHQSEKYRIYRGCELIGYDQEDCFVFTVQLSNSLIAIVYENINFARATEIFIIKQDSYNRCINALLAYFYSDLKMKRQNLREKTISPDKFFCISYHTINHDSLEVWNKQISTKFERSIDYTSDLFTFAPGLKLSNKKGVTNIKTSYYPEDLHDKLLSKLYNLLVLKYQKQNIGTEIHTLTNKRIDLVVRINDEYHFYEVKTHNDPRLCVREALGQIIDYAFFNMTKERVSKMYIVGPTEASADVDNYLKLIRQNFKLPIYYLSIQI